MKIEINKEEQNTEIKFPCLMEGETGSIYLIIGYSDCNRYYKGMALKHPHGVHYDNGWSKKLLTPFKGSITLSND
jgi:hypothetical protein